jgi:uncharacterized protein (DUF58 family)
VVQQLPQPEPTPGGLALERQRREGSEEWQDLRPHRPEDSPSRLAWSLVAQGRGSFSKRFVGPSESPPLLAPDPTLPFEQALEHLSERIWRLHGQGASYGLALRGERIEFRRGTSGGGNQLRQPYLRKLYGDAYARFPKIDHVHFFGYYIGNYPDLEASRVQGLCDLLNRL